MNIAISTDDAYIAIIAIRQRWKRLRTMERVYKDTTDRQRADQWLADKGYSIDTLRQKIQHLRDAELRIDNHVEVALRAEGKAAQ